jgi:hypothetical protein
MHSGKGARPTPWPRAVRHVETESHPKRAGPIDGAVQIAGGIAVTAPPVAGATENWLTRDAPFYQAGGVVEGTRRSAG